MRTARHAAIVIGLVTALGALAPGAMAQREIPGEEVPPFPTRPEQPNPPNAVQLTIAGAHGLLNRTLGQVVIVPLPEVAVAPSSTCLGQPATILGTPADDTIYGTAGPDVIATGPGVDFVFGRGGDDLICGEGDTDYLIGDGGDDHIMAGDGDDTLGGGGGDDLLDGDLGTDSLWGEEGDDRLDGNQGVDDFCNGGLGEDTVIPTTGALEACEHIMGAEASF